jgi:hypothetical protein
MTNCSRGACSACPPAAGRSGRGISRYRGRFRRPADPAIAPSALPRHPRRDHGRPPPDRRRREWSVGVHGRRGGARRRPSRAARRP